MKIAVLHNRYRQAGGEDGVFADETALLRSNGIEVLEYTVTNDNIDDTGPVGLVKASAATIWNHSAYKALRRFFREAQPDVAHFHNTFPLLSPAAYYAAQAEGVPVVQTLHNFRLLCPNAIFFRNGSTCELCLGKRVPWPAILHGCYRDSRSASAVSTALVTVHRLAGTWAGRVDAYVALTNYAREKYVQGGLPADKIVVKPNFVYPDPGWTQSGGSYFLFVGRLVPEKGIRTLLRAWEELESPIPLKIVGDGPLAAEVRERASRLSGVAYLGRRAPAEVHELLRGARALVFPSEWYETFGRVIIEAYAAATPVIAARIGAAGELVVHGNTGIHFAPGEVGSLVDVITWAWQNERQMAEMGRTARATYEETYTADRNYQLLMGVYRKAIEHGRSRQ